MNRLKVAACAVLAMSGASVGAWAAEPAGAGQTELGGPAVAGVCLLSQQAVLANAKAGVAASARLKQLADQAQAEVDGERGPIQADAKALAAQKAGLKPAEFQQREQALGTRLTALQQKADQRSREIEATRVKALGRIATEAQPVIAAVYKARGCGLLIDRGTVLGGNMAGDLTAAVVQGLDAKLASLTFERETQPAYTSSTYTKTLPFLTVNYRIRPNWAVYAQYAQGFLVPNVSAFYVNNPQAQRVVPQESTNYQIGTVFNSGKLTLDADLYYIDFQHKIQSLIDPTTNETYETNSGGATYKGIEGQATYVLPYGFSTFANVSINSAEGKDDPLNPGYNGRQLAKAPFWTGALGVRMERHGLLRPDDILIATLNDKMIGPQFATAASGVTPPTGKIHAFDQADLSATYKLGRYSLQVQLLNLFDSTDITSFKGKALIAGTNLPATTSLQGGAANVFSYQTGRSYQVTLKAAF